MRVWLVVAWAVGALAVDRPEDFVHPLAGTFTDGQRFSTGNTLPLIGRPWGFNHFAPQTTDGYSSWWFGGNDHNLRWIRLTHQPSPWIGDYGWFFLGPQMGPRTDNPTVFWEPRAAVIKPHLFDATTGPDGMRIELAPTLHGAIMRVTFPAHNPHNHDKNVCFRNDGQGNWKDIDGSSGTATGVSTRVNGNAPRFGAHMRVNSDTKVNSESHTPAMVCFSYGPQAQEVVVRVATSFISPHQAQVSLDREMPSHKSFDDIAAEARREWNELLKRVDVVDPGPQTEETDRHLGVFYTGLYRALCFPRRLDETTEDGLVVHYTPYGGGDIQPGVLVTDNGFWDTFRTVYPMLSLLYPDHLGWIVQGWLNAFKEGGWLPKWASPGYRSSMVGTFADVVVADAIVKDVQGFDRATAWAALHKDSFEPEPKRGGGAVAKVGLREYDDHHFVPSDSGVSEFVSRSVDFAFADAAVAQAARVLAQQEGKSGLLNDAGRLEGRASDVLSNLFDRQTGLMRPKRSNGQFDHISPTRWGGGYTEGSPWHHSFPPFNMAKLIELHGGKQNLARKLHELVESPGTFETGGYGQVIHEMSEMRAFAMGQYGHNNQPCHHLLWLFALLDEPSTTHHLVRRVIEHGYGTDFYAGDEDNGEMGAWFVLAALGLYAVSPGTTDEYVLGSPIFKHVKVSPATSAVSDQEALQLSPITRQLDIIARGTSRDAVDVRTVTWNQADLHGAAVISDHELQRGGQLRFVMEGEDPHAPAFPPAAAPASDAGLRHRDASSAPELDHLRRQAQAAEAEKAELAESLRTLETELEEERSHSQQASSSVSLLQQEHANDKAAWVHDTERLQKALADQAKDLTEMQTQLAHSVQSSSQAVNSQLDSKAELDAIKVELSVEQKEHKRSSLLQQMHMEQLERIVNAHRDLDKAGGMGETRSAAWSAGSLHLSNDSIVIILVASGLLTLIALAMHVSGASPVGGGLLGPRKSASHIV